MPAFPLHAPGLHGLEAVHIYIRNNATNATSPHGNTTESTQRPDGSGGSTFKIVAIVIASIIVLAAAAAFILSYFRRSRTGPGKATGTWFSRMFPSHGTQYTTPMQENRSFEDLSTANATRTQAVAQVRARIDPPSPSLAANRTSVRSIMTLPPYSLDLRPTEQLLGREGERGGIDTVVEFPETADEEESRRDEAMEGLYQIRASRRQEIADRQERRRLRHEARERGDTALLAQLAAQSRARAAEAEANNTAAEALIAEHQARGREGRISSVSYADLGVARHDGSRVRGGSYDSDSRPLLDAAAGMGSTISLHATRSSQSQSHLRQPSSTSVASTRPSYDYITAEDMDDIDMHDDASSIDGTSNRQRTYSVDTDSLALTPSGTSGNLSARRTRTHSNASGLTSGEPSPPAVQEANGSAPAPRPRTNEPEPPRYSRIIRLNTEAANASTAEGPRSPAPPYESPVSTGAPRLPRLESTPSIEIIPHTPVE